MVYLNPEGVSSILREGAVISTRLGGSMSWSGNVVYKSQGRILYVALTDSLLQNGIAQGRPISVKYVNEYFIYAFEGAVARVSTGYPAYAALRIMSAEEIINTRLSPRFDVQLEASLRPVWSGKSYPSTITDISFGGTAFICGKMFDYNEELDIDIRLHERQTIKARGKIVRRSIKNKTVEYSMQFLNMDEESCRILSVYFTKLQEETGRLYEYYLAEIKNKGHHFSC